MIEDQWVHYSFNKEFSINYNSVNKEKNKKKKMIYVKNRKDLKIKW